MNSNQTLIAHPFLNQSLVAHPFLNLDYICSLFKSMSVVRPMNLSDIVRTSFHTTDKDGRPVTLAGAQVVELLFMVKAIEDQTVAAAQAVPAQTDVLQDVTWGHGPKPVVTRRPARESGAHAAPSQGPRTAFPALTLTPPSHGPKTGVPAPAAVAQDVKRESMPSAPEKPPVVIRRALVCYTCGEQGHHRNRCDVYKTEMCWHHSIGKCFYGTKCYKAHSEKEFRALCTSCQITHAQGAHLPHAF